jgi:hypothetical protein
MRPGIGLCNRRSPRNGSRKYVTTRITPSIALKTLLIAATAFTPTKVLVTADAAWSLATTRGGRSSICGEYAYATVAQPRSNPVWALERHTLEVLQSHSPPRNPHR